MTAPITIPLPPKSFENVREVVAKEAKTMRKANSADQPRLSLQQDFALRRTAGEGVLGLLERMGVRGASTLADRLRADAKNDPYTDLVTVEIDIKNKLWAEDSNIEEERLVRLAQAAGGVANATVATLTGGNPDAIQSSITRAGRGVEEAGDRELDAEQLGSSIGSIATHALNEMLGEVKEIHLDDEKPEEPLAA